MKIMSHVVWAVLALMLTTACSGPMQVEKFYDVKPNESVFVIPVEGAAKSDQKQFTSVEYLESMKVATKRIPIPTRKRDLGRGPGNYEWVDTVAIIIVNRNPVTRELTADAKTGSSPSNQAITVESSDSIGFRVGVNLTGMIEEKASSKFLYYYTGRPLTEVMDTDVRGYLSSILSREFGGYTLSECRSKKNEIMAKARKEMTEHFEPFGITITSMGIAEGLTYLNPAIQTAIDNNFVAEQNKTIQANDKLAQVETNLKELSIAETARKKAEEFAKAEAAQTKLVTLDVMRMNAQANLVRAQKWNGGLPANIMPENSPILTGISNSGLQEKP